MGQVIRVASVSMAHEQRHPQSIADNLCYLHEVLDELAPTRPDLVALPEIFMTAGLGSDGERLPQSLSILQELAVQYHTMMVGSLYQERGGRRYNTATVVDGQGQVLGSYDKMHPTEGEIAGGIAAGAHGQPPVRTPLGTIGVQICFDANWPQGWADAAAAGARLIVFPSAFPGGRLLEGLALCHSVWVVPAVWSLHSGVLDNTGRWVAHTDRFSRWVTAEVNLQRTVFHWDFQGPRVKDIVARYGPRIAVETFGPEALFTLTPVDADLDIAEVIRAFELVPYRDYVARATAAQDAARENAARENAAP